MWGCAKTLGMLEILLEAGRLAFTLLLLPALLPCLLLPRGPVQGTYVEYQYVPR